LIYTASAEESFLLALLDTPVAQARNVIVSLIAGLQLPLLQG